MREREAGWYDIWTFSKSIHSNAEYTLFKDNLARLESESSIYNNYRKLIDEKPKGVISINYFDGSIHRKLNQYLILTFSIKSTL